MFKVDREKNIFTKKSSGAPPDPPQKKYPDIFGKIQKLKNPFWPPKSHPINFFHKMDPPKTSQNIAQYTNSAWFDQF